MKQQINSSIRFKYIHQCYHQSAESKRIYKLKERIREMSFQIKYLQTPCVFNHTVDITNYVLEKLEDKRRGKVRDGIIAVCIYYACKQMSYIINYNELSIALDLPIKYITTGETTILELINNDKIQLDKQLFMYNKTAYDYIDDISNLLPYNNFTTIKSNVINIIKICEDNNILFGYSPVVIAAGCLYYTIVINSNLDINQEKLAYLYKISTSTINKVNKTLLKNNAFFKNGDSN